MALGVGAALSRPLGGVADPDPHQVHLGHLLGMGGSGNEHSGLEAKRVPRAEGNPRDRRIAPCPGNLIGEKEGEVFIFLES